MQTQQISQESGPGSDVAEFPCIFRLRQRSDRQIFSTIVVIVVGMFQQIQSKILEFPESEQDVRTRTKLKKYVADNGRHKERETGRVGGPGRAFVHGPNYFLEVSLERKMTVFLCYTVDFDLNKLGVGWLDPPKLE